MNKFLLCLLAFTASNGFTMTWDQLIASHTDLLEENSVILRQYLSYAAQQSPTIADLRIKAIPILESGEECIDLEELGDDRLQMMPAPLMPFEGPIFHSGLPNASKMRLGLYRKLQKMIASLDDLSIAFGYEPGQICIRVFEALRDIETQKILFQKKFEEISFLHPHLTVEEIEKETTKWISPVKNNIPVHSTGAAVDIRLWDNRTKSFLDMGVFGVIWGANDSAPTFSENISDEQKKNRLYCLLAAEFAELTNYSYEFWHFSSQDRFAIYWEGKDGKAAYGAVTF